MSTSVVTPDESAAHYVESLGTRWSATSEQHRLEGQGISISGLDKEAIARIEEIGFDAWLDEAKDLLPAKKTMVSLSTYQKARKERPIRKLLCQKCGEVFLSHTRKTKFCPDCGGVTDILQKAGKQLRACASGAKCLKSGKRGIPAPAAPGKQFCTEMCHGSHLARQGRLKAVAQAARPSTD
jgi:hypothetical protein